MTMDTQRDWDPKSDAVLRDQRAAYDEMRERCPVAYSDFLGTEAITISQTAVGSSLGYDR